MKKLIISEIISIGIVLTVTLLICLLMNYYKPTHSIPLFEQNQVKEQTKLAAAITIVIALIAVFTAFRPNIILRHATSPGNYLVAKSKADSETISLVIMGTATAAFAALFIAAESAKEAFLFIAVLVVTSPTAITEGGILGLVVAIFIFTLIFAIANATDIPLKWTGKSYWAVDVHPKDEKPIFEVWDSHKGLLTGLITWLTNFGILYGLPKLLI